MELHHNKTAERNQYSFKGCRVNCGIEGSIYSKMAWKRSQRTCSNAETDNDL